MMMPLLLLRKKNKPTVDLSFLGGAMPDGLTFTRASAGWRFNSARVLTQASANEPRFDNDPVTGAGLGLLIEEQRTNYIRNSTMTGASSSPSTFPANWSVVNGAGLSKTIVGTGTEQGMPYVDIRFQGTPSDSVVDLRFEDNTQAPALQNQAWTSSVFIKRSGGSFVNINYMQLITYARNSGGSLLSQFNNGDIIGLIATDRYVRTVTSAVLSDATTAYACTQLAIGYVPGAAVDVTLRFAQPQLEQGAFASSPVVTAGSAVTRASDNLLCSSLPWFNASGGAFAVEGMVYALPVARVASCGFTDSTNNNVIASEVNSGGTSVDYITIASTDYHSAASAGAVVANGVFKQGLAYTAGANKGAFNGTIDGGGDFGTCGLPGGINALRMGSLVNERWLNGWVRRFRYWNYPLSDTKLQQVTL